MPCFLTEPGIFWMSFSDGIIAAYRHARLVCGESKLTKASSSRIWGPLKATFLHWAVEAQTFKLHTREAEVDGVAEGSLDSELAGVPRWPELEKPCLKKNFLRFLNFLLNGRLLGHSAGAGYIPELPAVLFLRWETLCYKAVCHPSLRADLHTRPASGFALLM